MRCLNNGGQGYNDSRCKIGCELDSETTAHVKEVKREREKIFNPMIQDL